MPAEFRMYCHEELPDIVLLDLPVPSCRQESSPCPLPSAPHCTLPVFFSFLPPYSGSKPIRQYFSPQSMQLPVTVLSNSTGSILRNTLSPGHVCSSVGTASGAEQAAPVSLRQIGTFSAPVLLHQLRSNVSPAEQIIFRPRLPKSFRIALQKNFFSILLKHRHFIPQLRKPKINFPSSTRFV